MIAHLNHIEQLLDISAPWTGERIWTQYWVLRKLLDDDRGSGGHRDESARTGLHYETDDGINGHRDLEGLVIISNCLLVPPIVVMGWSRSPRLACMYWMDAGFYFHGLGSGTSHGPATSTLVKSAGPTISRYSMSAE